MIHLVDDRCFNWMKPSGFFLRYELANVRMIDVFGSENAAIIADCAIQIVHDTNF